jgi:hypothetical protein
MLGIAVMAAALKPDPKAIVAKVGERSYTYKSYNDGFKAYLSYHLGGKVLTAQDSTRINDQYWSELIGIYIYDQAIKAGKVKVTDAEIEKDVIANPPDGVKIIKDFHTNGAFDAKKFKQALKDRPDFKQSVIDFSRDLFTYQKLIRTIKNEAVIYPDSIKADWLKDNNKADATIVLFDYTRLPHINSPDAELEQYYQQHLTDYKRENGRSYLYVRFSLGEAEGKDSEAKYKDIKNKSSALHTRAKEIGLQAAAKEAKLSVAESGDFGIADKDIPHIGSSTGLVSFAFANAKGAIPGMFYASNGDTYVCEVYGDLPEYYLEFASQKPEIDKALSRSKRIAQMHGYATAFYQQQSPETFLETAARDSLIIIEAQGITADAPIKSIGKYPALNQAILNTPEGSFTPLIEKENRWLLPMVNKRYLPDLAVWERDKQSIIAEASATIQQEHLNTWYNQERSKLQIIDNRKDFYTLARPNTR